MQFITKLIRALKKAKLEVFYFPCGGIKISAKTIYFYQDRQKVNLTFCFKSFVWVRESTPDEFSKTLLKINLGVYSDYWKDIGLIGSEWLVHSLYYHRLKSLSDISFLNPEVAELKQELESLKQAASFQRSELELTTERSLNLSKWRFFSISQPNWRQLKFPAIYRIWNTVNNYQYIGQTQNLHKRLNRHRGDLIGNRHDCRLLQLDWNRYGEKSFKWILQEQCPTSMCQLEREGREIFWQKAFGAEYSNFMDDSTSCSWLEELTEIH